MFDSIGHSVVKLRRVAIGPLQHERLPLKAYRLLAEAEVKRFFAKSKSRGPVATKTHKSHKVKIERQVPPNPLLSLCLFIANSQITSKLLPEWGP
jgi:23S rRNA pseudouridine2605 synthase